MKKLNNILFFSVALLIFSCESKRITSNQNLALLYQKEAFLVHPSFCIFHETDSISQIHFMLKSSEFLYARQPDNDEEMTAKIRVSYKLFPSYESPVILDSNFIVLSDKYDGNNNKEIVGVLELNAKKGGKYLLEITVTDMVRSQNTLSYLNIIKQNDNSAQNFFVKNPANNVPYYSHLLKAGEIVNIRHKDPTIKKLIVKYYNNDYPIALPPFALAPQKGLVSMADTIFPLIISENTFNITMPTKGFYHIQTDTSVRDGLTLYSYNDGFPQINKVDQMIGPLRYITASQEFIDIESSKKPKVALDNFWMDCAGNPDRAKELIKKYYSRVADANLFFSSYLEGWKTDRGMIYMVYGPPNVVYKSTGAESWVYGEENNMQSLSFAFFKMDNPFTDNDYSLDRSSVYEKGWYNAVDIWRQGRIY